MGKSKFPGKPSRLVNKKRVSVLSGAGLNTLASGASSDEDNNQQQQQHQEQENSSSTTEKLNQSLIHSQQQQQQQQQKQNQQPSSAKVSTSLLDNEEIDQDGDDDVSKVFNLMKPLKWNEKESTLLLSFDEPVMCLSTDAALMLR